MQEGPNYLPGIPGAEPPQPRRQWLAWLEFALALALTLLFALAALGIVIELTSSKHLSSGTSRSGQVVTGVVCLGLLVLSGWWARRVEHRIRYRRGNPAAMSLEAEHKRAAVRPGRFRRRRHYGPTAAVVNVTLFGLGTVGLIAYAFVLRADGARSSFVQHHGIPAAAVITDVNNIEDCGRSSCWWHAKISVRLRAPVEGATTTVVSYPERSELDVGQPVRVLVDPNETGYAEFRGSPSVVSWQWIAIAAFAVFLAVLEALSIRRLWQLLKRRREVRTPGVTSPAIAPS